MKSPSMDVIARRRYHKPKHKAKRKDSNSRHNKETSNKGKAPQITQKRLTNKSGFYFKNAVLSSPHLRRTNGHSQFHEPKRGSTDFDLLCLLEAAKGTNAKATSASHSASMSTSSEEYDKHYHLDDTLIEDNISKQKTRNRIHEHRPRNDIKENFRSFTENKKILLDNNAKEFIDLQHAEKMVSHTDVTNFDPETPHNNDMLTKEHNLDPNISNENSVARTKLKPGSFSSYYKFGVGVIDALLSEKKKQFPCDIHLKDDAKDLINIYSRTHDKMLNKEDFSVNINPNAETCKDLLQVETLNTSSIAPENICLTLHTNQGNDLGCKGLKEKNNQDAMTEQVLTKYQQKEKTFKEKSVEAWVDALPENMPLQGNTKYHSTHEFSSKHGAVQTKTEDDFLKKFKMNPIFQFKHSKHASQSFKIKNSGTEFDLWNKDYKDDVIIPSISPYKTPPNVISSAYLGGDCSKIKNVEPAIIFDQSLVSLNRSDHIGNFWERSMNKSENEKHPALWERNKLKHRRVTMKTPQQPWLSWFKKQDEHRATGDIRLESPACLSPSLCFTFDPLTSKRTCVRQKTFGYGTSENVNSHIRKTTERKQLWNPFPKLLHRNINEEHLPVFMACDTHTTRRYGSIEEPSSPPSCVKFSPRNMF